MKKLFKTLILISLTLGIILSLFIYNISPHSTKKFTTDYFDTNPFTVESATNKTRPINNLDQKENTKQILWGDTHVHTTYSMDAFYMSLPMMHGSRGAFPAAFACDYARFISQLDFYVLTDHAESYIPRTWKDQVDSIRQCNAISGNEDNPDLVAFIGWEWTQAGATPETHYGHHNVIFKDYKEGQIPDRPIAAGGALSNILRTQLADVNRNLFLLDPLNRDYYWSFANYLDAILSTPNCEKGIPSNYLPKDCYETASTPGELYAKLDDWGFDVEVIPHGTTWGFYTPQAATWEEYTSTPDNIRPDYNSLVEIYSGHGNSEGKCLPSIEKISDWIEKVLNQKIKIDINPLKNVAPGQSKLHYSPGIPIRMNVIKPKKYEAYILIKKRRDKSSNYYYLSKNKNLKEAARNLYSCLRKIKNKGYKSIAIENISNIGLGKSINDRLNRASKY